MTLSTVAAVLATDPGAAPEESMDATPSKTAQSKQTCNCVPAKLQTEQASNCKPSSTMHEYKHEAAV
jgi:hypothetical protein